MNDQETPAGMHSATIRRNANFVGYANDGLRFDETLSSLGEVRPAYADLLQLLDNGTAPEHGFLPGLGRVQRRVQRQLEALSPPAHLGQANERTQLDPLPLLLHQQDWETLSHGLKQRANLLSQLTQDFYGAQELLRGGLLPPALAFANDKYLLPAVGSLNERKQRTSTFAFDLARSPEGQWWVLDQQTDMAAEMGQCLENRQVMIRCVPDLLRALGVTSLAGFFSRFGESLGDMAQSDELTVILGGSADEGGYTEQSLLSRHLGHPLVQGADLAVHDKGVFLRTLEGLKLIGSIYRQLDSSLCDPLELRNRSAHGTPGLLDAVRNGQVSVNNIIGSGVVENQAMLSFLPGLCRHLLNEEIALPSLATWWCGQEDELAAVLDAQQRLQVVNAFGSLPAAELLPRIAAGNDNQSTPADVIRHQPFRYVGREHMYASQAPVLSDSGVLQPGTLTVRMFVAQTANGFDVLPGGVAKVFANEKPVVKDVWVLTSTPATAARSVQPAAVRRSDRNIASRYAENLYWFGRYLERAETFARALRFGFRANESENASLQNIPSTLTHLLSTLADGGSVPTTTQDTAADQLWQIWQRHLDPANPAGLVRTAQALQHTVQATRSRLSPDVWRLLNQLDMLPSASERHAGETSDTLVDTAQTCLEQLLDRLAAVNGHVAENMTQGYGWRFLEIGKRLERASYTLELISALARSTDANDAQELSCALHLSDSTITHRARYQTLPTLPSVLDLLLLDGSNPRSVMHQYSALQVHLQVLPLERSANTAADGTISDAARLILTAQNEMTLANLDKLSHQVSAKGQRTTLHRLVKRLRQSGIELGALLSASYFEHKLRNLD